MNITVHKALKSDISILQKYILEIEQYHLDLSDFLIKNNNDVNDEYFFNKHIVSYLIKNEDVTIGFYRVQLNKKPNFTKGSVLFIDPIYIIKKFRNKGIGKKIITEIEDFAKSNNYVNIMLNVWSFNENATSFYSKNGFENLRETKIKTI